MRMVRIHQAILVATSRAGDICAYAYLRGFSWFSFSAFGPLGGCPLQPLHQENQRNAGQTAVDAL